MTEEMKGALFVGMMIPIGIRIVMKAANNDLSLDWFDYLTTTALVVVIVLFAL